MDDRLRRAKESNRVRWWVVRDAIHLLWGEGKRESKGSEKKFRSGAETMQSDVMVCGWLDWRAVVVVAGANIEKK